MCERSPGAQEPEDDAGEGERALHASAMIDARGPEQQLGPPPRAPGLCKDWLDVDGTVEQPAEITLSEDDAVFWVVGHRGAPASSVENTIPSFERALADGANGLEVDLSVTSDGEIALWHDFNPQDFRARLRRLGLEPTVRYRPRAPDAARFLRPVGDLTLAELRRHYGYAEKSWGGGAVPAEIPTLRDFLAWGSSERALGLVFLDVKVPDDREDLLRVLLKELDELIARHQPRFHIILESESAGALQILRRLGAAYDLALDVEPPPGIVTDWEECSAANHAIVNGFRQATAQRPRSITLFPFKTHRQVVLADLARLREHNANNPAASVRGLHAFTINEEVEMRELVQLGISGIQSDRPDLLRRVASASGKVLEVR